MPQLTNNGVSLILSGRLQPSGSTSVVLQVLKVSEMPTQCYLVVSDGTHHVTSVLHNAEQSFKKLDIVEVRVWALARTEGGVLLQLHDVVAVAEAPAMIGAPEAALGMQGLQAKAAPCQKTPNPYALQAGYSNLQQGQGIPAKTSVQSSSPSSNIQGPGVVDMWRSGYGMSSTDQGNLQTPIKTQDRQRHGQTSAGAAAAAARAATFPIMPIAQLTPYIGQWKIRVRVVGKSDVRHFTNSRGEGKLLSIHIVDEEGSECRATFFGDAVDKFNDSLTPNGIYDIAGGRVKPGNPRYSPHAVEITLDENAAVNSVDSRVATTFPPMRYDFVPLSKLPQIQVQAGVTVDVGAVVMELWEPTTVTMRTGALRPRRNIKVVDASNSCCMVGLWGVHAEMDIEIGSVLFMRRARLSDYRGGRSLESSDMGFIEVDPDHQYAFQLRRWYNEQRDKSASPQLLSGGGNGPLRLLGEVQLENAQTLFPGAPNPVRAYRVSPVTVAAIPHERPTYYMACNADVPGFDGKGTRRCNRKTLPTGDGWQCSAGHAVATASPRYVLRLQIADATMGGIYVTAFDEQAQTILGVPAQELHDLEAKAQEGHHDVHFEIEAIFKRATLRRWAVRLRSQLEDYNGKSTVKTQISECTRVHFSADAKDMLAEVKQALFNGSAGGA